MLERHPGYDRYPPPNSSSERKSRGKGSGGSVNGQPRTTPLPATELPLAASPPPESPSADHAEQPRRRVPRKLTVTRVVAMRSLELTEKGFQTFQRAAKADGAGESGLTALVYATMANFALDAAIAVALANTLFFASATAESKSKVALYLLITIAPFAVIAPLIGPLLDRLQRGRRLALAGSFAVRIAFILLLIFNVNSWALYPLALGAMILSKSFAVLKSAVTPRVLPPGIDLVRTNSRLTVFGLVGGTLGAGAVAGAIATVAGSAGALIFAALIAAGGAYLSLRIPSWVEVTEGEVPTTLGYHRRDGHLVAERDERPTEPHGRPATKSDKRPATKSDKRPATKSDERHAAKSDERPAAGNDEQPTGEPDERHAAESDGWPAAGNDGRPAAGNDGRPAAEPDVTVQPARRRQPLGRSVVTGLWGNSSIRVLTGFLTFYVAFVAKSTEHRPVQQAAMLGAVGAAAAIGNFIGNASGARLTLGRPALLVVSCTAACTAAAIFATFLDNLLGAAVAALIGAGASALAKVSLDASIQDDLPPESIASGFGRSETVLQLSWVIGGAGGVLLPTEYWKGFAVVTALLAVGLAQTVVSYRGHSLLPGLGGNRPQHAQQEIPGGSADISGGTEAPGL
ncbi:hypothetical protein NRB56_02860 [Nocardia sp. RB56]|uniref:MFS transporter n=2 Tax=Nocardia aurantia TaxID=2585199 RepID=A0A7K0DFZ2_9NOCA|nr:MFS transporter [Nocardia aurantia]MQY24733.1 hypothetical protein [Nocardia aurantia]